MKKINTKRTLIKLEKAVTDYGGWFWHEELTGIEQLEETVENCFWDKTPNFEYLALEILKYLEIINEYHVIQTETIQFKGAIWSDEDEFLYHGGNDDFDSFGEYLECKKVDTFYDLREILINELIDIHTKACKEISNEK